MLQSPTLGLFQVWDFETSSGTYWLRFGLGLGPRSMITHYIPEYDKTYIPQCTARYPVLGFRFRWLLRRAAYALTWRRNEGFNINLHSSQVKVGRQVLRS